jgi:hypothetical protein
VLGTFDQENQNHVRVFKSRFVPKFRAIGQLHRRKKLNNLAREITLEISDKGAKKTYIPRHRFAPNFSTQHYYARDSLGGRKNNRDFADQICPVLLGTNNLNLGSALGTFKQESKNYTHSSRFPLKFQAMG